MHGAETPDLIELDVGVLRLRDDGTGDPPVGAGQPGGQVGPGSGLPILLGAAGMCNNFAVCRLPQPDTARFFSEDDRVIPPPDHRSSAIGPGRDGY